MVTEDFYMVPHGERYPPMLSACQHGIAGLLWLLQHSLGKRYQVLFIYNSFRL